MRNVTIYQKYGTVQTVEGRLAGARRTWTVTSQVDIYLAGAFDERGKSYAQYLACIICQNMNIPLTQCVRIDKPIKKPEVKRHKNSRLLF